MSKLQEIVTHKRLELVQHKANQAFCNQWHDAKRLSEPKFLQALRVENASPTPLPRFIFELKPSAPSQGVLQETPDLDVILKAYNAHATALSVLTDLRYFNGSFALLKQVALQTPLPILCKEFVLDPIQLRWARCAGASAVLLIAKALDDTTLAALYAETKAWGMTPVLEVQNEAECQRILPLKPEVVLINNRNLDTLDIDLNTTARLAPLFVNSNAVLISASGFETQAQVAAVLPHASCFLVGSHLMRHAGNLDDLQHALSALGCHKA